MRLNEECRTCALAEDCGRTFTPHIDAGECGHSDGCMSWMPSKEAKQ